MLILVIIYPISFHYHSRTGHGIGINLHTSKGAFCIMVCIFRESLSCLNFFPPIHIIHSCIHAAWTSSGTVMVKLEESSTPVPIKTHRELANLLRENNVEVWDMTKWSKQWRLCSGKWLLLFNSKTHKNVIFNVIEWLIKPFALRIVNGN